MCRFENLYTRTLVGLICADSSMIVQHESNAATTSQILEILEI